MYNKKLLLTVLKDLNKAKKPTKKKDINYDATGKGMLNKNYAGKPVRLATDTLYNPTPYRINAKSDNGIEQTLEPYDETTVNFPGANYIDEYPEMKKGGGFSKNLLATNRLFKKNTLFKKNQLIKPNKLFKKKSYKRKTYDPLSMYFQDGGENKTKLNKKEEKEFQKFYKTLPENLQTDDNTYDIRGYWDALGRPQEFDYTQPTEADGYYHAFSINPNTGEYLKSPAHPTFQQAVDEDRKIGYRPIPNVYGRNIATYNESIADPEQQTFLRNTEGPANYIETELTPEEIEQYKKGGYIVEDISIPSLNKFAPGGAPCQRGYIRDASGKCVPYNWNTGNIQAADSYAGMYGGYDSSGVKNLSQVQATAKKGKKFSDYILRGGKSRADVARNLGKNAGAYFGMPGEALEPVNFTKAGLDKFTTDVKNAKKNFEAEEKNKAEYEKARKKLEKSKDQSAGTKFRQEYEKKGWDRFDTAVAEGSGPGADYSATDARKEWGDSDQWNKFTGLVSNAATAIPLLGAAGAMGSAGAALLENPVVQGGLTAYGAYDATTNTIPEAYKDFSEGRYLEGAGNVALAGLDVLPGVALAGKGAKLVGKGLDLKKIKLPAIGNKAKNAEVPTLSDQTYRSAEIERFNPKTKKYDLYSVELPTKIIPGREYADVKHKMSNLKKDLGINMVTDAINKFIPGASHPIGMAKDSGLVIDPKTGKLFDSNTRYWLNREYGYTPDINELLAPMSSSIAENYGKLIKTSDVPLLSKPGINYLDEVPLKQYGGALKRFINGGEEDCPEGYMRSYNGKCVPSPISEQAADEEWYRNWYANRVIQDEEGQKLLDNARSKILKRAEKFPETTWYSEPGSSNFGSFEPLTGELRLNSDALDNNPFLKNEVKFHEKGHYLTSPNMLDPETDTVEEVVAHPIQHLRNYEANIVDQALKSRKDVPKEDRDFYDYLKGVGNSQPYTEEISKNLMQLRRLAGFKPDQVITEEDINNLYKKADEKGWTDPNSDFFVEPFLNLINYTKDTEQLKTLFNKLAKNEPEQQDDIKAEYAKYGGGLNRFVKGGGKKKKGKKTITKPGEWAGVNPELVQPGNEGFDLPTTPTVPAEFETIKCPIFHRYDPSVGDCVPFTEEEKAAYALDYMQGWVGSPRHEQMLRASIEKDAPAGNVDKYVKDITDLRLRATDPNISIVSPDDSGNYGVAEPLSLKYHARYKLNKLPISLRDTEAIKRGQGKYVKINEDPTDGAYRWEGHDFDTLANPNKSDLENYIKYNSPLYMESGVNNLEFFNFDDPNYEGRSLIDERGNITNRIFINKKTGEKVNMLPEIKSLKQPATFYTKNLAGEHGYVYPHEFSHLQDMGGDLIIPSDKNLMLKYFQPQLNAADEMYEKTSKVYDKYYRPKGVYDNPSKEDEKKYKEEIGNIFIDSYPSFTSRYNLDKNLYENNFDKYVLQNQHRFKDKPTNNSLPYDEFIKQYFSPANFGDPAERAGYLGNDSESRAKLNAVRMYGKASGTYDPYTEQLTPEKYNQLKELFQQQNPNAEDANQLEQLREIYTDEQIFNLLNTISKNEPEQVDQFQPQNARYGGALNKFIGGGSPCDDGYTYDPKLGCIPLSEKNMTEDQKWMVEWYKNRKIDFPEDQPSFKKVVEKVLPAYNPESPMLEQMQSFPVYETMPEEYMQENIGGFPAAGMYDPSGKVPKIYFNPQLTPEQKSDTERHELTNYLMEPVKDKLYPMYNKIVEENIIPFDENWPKEKQDFYDYVIDPEEQNIQSYLNVARKKFNLKADEVITPERLNQMREEAEKKGMLDKDNKNFNQDIYLLFKMAKDDEGLMKWFNLIAKKDSNKDNIQYGKYGGSLHKFIEGGDRPCPPGQKYNTKTGKCEYILADHAPLNILRDEKRKKIERLDKFGNLIPILDEILPGSSYNPEYIQNLKEFAMTERPQWKKDRDKFGKDKIAFYESLNPKKWGLNDYSEYSSYNSAFRNARESGEKEFVYKGKRYNTNLVPKEQSDLYWESKDFLKEYYKTQPFIKDNSGTDPSSLANYQKQKYGFTTTELLDIGFDNLSAAENELLTEMMEEENAILKGKLVYETEYNSPIFIKARKERLKKLDKPSYFSITTQKPNDMEEEGHWKETKNKMFVNAKNDKLNTTYIHELSHKGDDSYEALEAAPPIDMHKFNTQNLRIRGWTQEDFDYISSPSEIESRKLSTLFYLYKNKKPWKAGKITKESLDNLYNDINNLPFDIKQLLELYDAQQDDLLNYLNSTYYYEKKKEGGAVNYQLGDEIDEATMNELKKLGYTFEEL